MAEVLIYRVTFTAPSPYGTYVGGDVVDVYYDKDLETPPAIYSIVPFVVRKNGVVITSGPIIPYSAQSYKISQFTPFSYCYGSDLVNPIPNIFGTFPYCQNFIQFDAPACEVDPATCDLIVVGVPSVVPATGATSADGSITVTATSSNAIEYKLGSDFVYGDGTGQASGTFSGLLPGSKRIYLRDSKNCATNVLVNIPVDNSYGTKFRLEYTDNKGELTRIDINKRAYSGAITEVCGSDTPLTISLRGEGSTNKLEALLAIQATINLVSETDQQFLELYTNDRNLYRLNYYKDSDLKLIAKVLPQQYLEEYRFPPYYVSVTATDGLPELSQYYLIQDDGQKYYGEISIIKLVAYCLSTLKLDLPIRVACNLYATGMDTTAADDPFDQAYVDFERFYLATSEPKLDFVLRSLLEPFGARITQWEGRWNIIRVEEMLSSYDYRDFDKDGEYVSNGTFNPVIDIDFPDNNGDVILANRDHALELRPGYGFIKLFYELGLKPNILDNGDFRLKSVYLPEANQYIFDLNRDGWLLVNAGYSLTESFETIDENNVAYLVTGSDMVYNTEGGNAYLQSATYSVKMGTNNQLKIVVRYKVERVTATFGGLAYTVEVPYVKLRVRVKYGSLYLQSNGTWSSTENTLTFFANEFDKFTDAEILAKYPTSGTPTDGMDFEVRVYHAYAYWAQFQSLTALRAFATYNSGSSTQLIPTGYKTELRDAFSYPSYMYYYELEETTDAASGYLIVRPDDYHSTNNPRQWVQKSKALIQSVAGTDVFPFAIDRVKVTYLTDGKDPIDTIIRSATAEANNNEVLEKTLIFGSYSNLVVTETQFGLDLGVFFPKPGLTTRTLNILSSDLIYTGWLRNASGVGYENWSRDGVAESDKLHGILLKTYAAQYRKSWKLFRGSLYANTYFGFLNVARMVQDGNTVFLPIGLELDDKRCMYSGELLELVTGTAGSDGSGSAPYSSGFSTGFGQSGFN